MSSWLADSKPVAMCVIRARSSCDRVDGAGGQQVVADRDAVPALLGGPAVHPGAPGAVAAEERGDLVVVAGQVVLGEQVDDQRGAGDVGDCDCSSAHASPPSDAVEVAARRSTARTRAGTTPWPSSGAG